MKMLRENNRILMAYLIVIMAFLMQACARQLSPQEPCNFVMNSQQQRISWEHFSPAVLYIHESVPEEYHETIVAAADAWNELLEREVLVIADEIDHGEKESRTDGISVIYYMLEWEEDRQDEQARTQVRWRGSRILEADVLLNNVNFNFSVDEVVPYNKVDLMSLMIHEFGHVLGLNHIDDHGAGETVMFRTLSKGQDRRELEVGGVEHNSLMCEY